MILTRWRTTIYPDLTVMKVIAAISEIGNANHRQLSMGGPSGSRFRNFPAKLVCLKI
jgi:hypothetical protein